MVLTPTFDSDTEEYEATTTNAADKVTATPSATGVDITIMLGETEIQNGENATWESGENELTITVSCAGGEDTVYTVTVTAGEGGG